MNNIDDYWYTPAWLSHQKTIKQPIWCCGTGLHSGQDSRVQLVPANVNTGIVFQIMNGSNVTENIPAHIDYVKSGKLRTVLQSGNSSVETTEHLLAACMARGISNLQIQVWGNEIPIHDGSAGSWIFLLDCAGTQIQESYIKSIEILKEVEVRDGYAYCKLSPSTTFKLDYHLGYDHHLLGSQHYEFDFNQTNFDKNLANARTFGFIKDLEQLLIHGLSKGAGLHNTLVFGKDNLLNPEGMSWIDEPVRHKIVDAIGDLSLAGAPIVGKFSGYRSGHHLNHLLVSTLLKDTACWKWI
jgi:UDP-3-O-[3-hydroxymyristoyl] N-acetylglucosamine deacetylase